MAVEFNEPNGVVRSSAHSRRTSMLSRFLIRTGIVKTETGAQIVYFILALLCIAVGWTFLARSVEEPPQPTPEQVVL